MAALDPYLQQAMSRRMGNYSPAYSPGQMGTPGVPQGGFSRGYAPRGPRLPIMPDMSEQPSASPGGSGTGGTMGGAAANARIEEGVEKEQQRGQQDLQTLNAGRLAQTGQFMSDQARDISAYRQARDNGPGAAASADQRSQATILGIDPSSSAADIAAATAAGKSPSDQYNATQQPAAAVRTAVANIQSARDGTNAMTGASAFASGVRAGTPPAPPNNYGMPTPVTTPSMGLRPATGAPSTGAPAPAAAPVSAPAAPTPAPVAPGMRQPSPILRTPVFPTSPRPRAPRRQLANA